MDEAPDARLRRVQKNEVFGWLQTVGLAPIEFKWELKLLWQAYSGGISDYKVDSLTHSHTGYYFSFGHLQDEWSPGWTARVASTENSHNWAMTKSDFGVWAKLVKADIEAPDLWATAIQSKEFASVATTEEAENTPFSLNERKYILQKLSEIEKYLLATEQVNSKDREFVRLQFKYLAESSERLGRKDWKNGLVGVVTNIVVGAVFAPQRTQELFTMIASAFLPLFQHILQLPAVPLS